MGRFSHKNGDYYISCLIKGKKKEHVLEILSDYFFTYRRNKLQKSLLFRLYGIRVLSCYNYVNSQRIAITTNTSALN